MIFSDTLHHVILLDFGIKHKITKSSLQKSTKTQAVYHMSVKLVIEHLEAIHALTTLVFTEKRYGTYRKALFTYSPHMKRIRHCSEVNFIWTNFYCEIYIFDWQ